MWTATSILRLVCTAAVIAIVSPLAAAQTAANYPNKPVRVILPYAAGGGTSTTANIYADKLSKELGQNFVVDNRSGGNTIIGTQAVAHAIPDGYTLLVATDTLPIINWTLPNLPFDVLKDFVGVSTLIRSESMIAVHPSVPANTFKEFVAYAKQNPSKINARIQVATSSHVALVLFMEATGTNLTLIPYKGSGSAVIDLLSGETQFSMTNPSNLIPHIKTGKLKGLAVSGVKRNPEVPDIPTFAQVGLNNFDVATGWHMLLAPAATPRDIVEKLNASVAKAQASKDVQDALAVAGIGPYPLSVAATNALLRSQLTSIGKVIKEHNIKPESF